MVLPDIKVEIEKKLVLGAINSNTILSKFRVIDESSRKSAAYLDSFYFPFYFHLGKYIQPKSMAEIGFNLGLPSCSFMQSCKSVEKFLGFNEESVNFRIGKSNIKLIFRKEAQFCEGKFHEFPNIKLDFTIINEEMKYDKCLECLETIWEKTEENGLIALEHIRKKNKEAFYAFCESKNRNPEVFETRYGAGIIQK